MEVNKIQNLIGKVFNDIADAIENGQFTRKIKVGITTLGSELGIDNIVKSAEIAQERDKSIEIVLIGPKVNSKLIQVLSETEEDGHKKMEQMLDNGEIDACVTMHYNFPIGVSTVGRIPTPGRGKEMFLATTTGTASNSRIESMVKNGIYGIIVAKTMGIDNPTIGILNIDGSRQVERIFKELNTKGYTVNFVESGRDEVSTIMRGNDLLIGTSDIMISDTLTGNILMKVFSSFTTGGYYESQGFGYGPGIGENYDRLILIISRTSGIPVVTNAISYAASLVKGDIKKVAKEQFDKVNAVGLKQILKQLNKENKKVIIPLEEVVTAAINGIDIMELEGAVEVLWKKGIYAETGMGCVGPIVMVHEDKLNKAIKILEKEGYIVEETNPC